LTNQWKILDTTVSADIQTGHPTNVSEGFPLQLNCSKFYVFYAKKRLIISCLEEHNAHVKTLQITGHSWLSSSLPSKHSFIKLQSHQLSDRIRYCYVWPKSVNRILIFSMTSVVLMADHIIGLDASLSHSMHTYVFHHHQIHSQLPILMHQEPLDSGNVCNCVYAFHNIYVHLLGCEILPMWRVVSNISNDHTAFISKHWLILEDNQ
jgi:hypothetical protein